jgi:hypothetical protein
MTDDPHYLTWRERVIEGMRRQACRMNARGPEATSILVVEMGRQRHEDAALRNQSRLQSRAVDRHANCDRFKRAESAPTRVAAGKTGVHTEAVIP